MVTPEQPVVSVVIVSDYDDRDAPGGQNERRILAALARQDFDEPFEVILMESDQRPDRAPDVMKIVPGLRLIRADVSQSAELKDLGVRRARADLVAVFEADCEPNPCWLTALVGVLRRHPQISAVSGRTTYGSETMYRRALSLVDRSFDDLGHAGPSASVSNNAALYRRSLLSSFPHPPAISPFTSGLLRLLAMRSAGHEFYFEPRAIVRHAVGGLGFIRDFRRNTGYTDMACHSRRGLRAIPFLLGRRARREIADCRRLGRRYLRWYDWPLVALLLIAARAFEVPGMLDALRGREAIPDTSYR